MESVSSYMKDVLCGRCIDVSSSYMDNDSEMCVRCQSQNVPQNDSKKVLKFWFYCADDEA